MAGARPFDGVAGGTTLQPPRSPACGPGQRCHQGSDSRWRRKPSAPWCGDDFDSTWRRHRVILWSKARRPTAPSRACWRACPCRG